MPPGLQSVTAGSRTVRDVATDPGDAQLASRQGGKEPVDVPVHDFSQRFTRPRCPVLENEEFLPQPVRQHMPEAPQDGRMTRGRCHARMLSVGGEPNRLAARVRDGWRPREAGSGRGDQ